jgi:hypothetical protein
VEEGTFVYVANKESEFHAFFGFTPTYSGTSVVNFNGDDAMLLFNQDSVVDVIGNGNQTAVDGGWGYQDGWLYRRNNTEPDGDSFTGSQHWSMNHQDALDGYSTNAAALAASSSSSSSSVNSVGFPLGSYAPQGWSPMASCQLVDPCPCHVVTDHVAINCSTVPGAGAGHAWVVSVAEQESTAATTAYGLPVVQSLSGPGSVNASTYGNQAVTITGESSRACQILRCVCVLRV